MSGSPDEALAAFKETMVRAYGDPGFRHHRWYLRHHLLLVEKLALELLDLHPEADRRATLALVWLHDYGKALGREGEEGYALTLSEGEKRLREAGFPEEFVSRVVGYAGMTDRSRELDLHQAPVEVRIVSSADGCSHLLGPFFHLYWWENSGQPIDDLMAENRRKLLKDWTRKVVLPEARAAFQGRFGSLLEQAGELPSRFFS